MLESKTSANRIKWRPHSEEKYQQKLLKTAKRWKTAAAGWLQSDAKQLQTNNSLMAKWLQSYKSTTDWGRTTTQTCKTTTTRGKRAERICKSSAMSRWQKKKKKNKLEKRRDNCRGTNQLHSMLRRLQNIYRQRQGDTKHYRVERQTNNYRGRKRRGDFRVKINNWRETERVSLCLFQFANLWLRIEKWFLFSEKSKESLAFTARL